MRLGIESSLQKSDAMRRWGRCAFLGNQASLLGDFTPSWKALYQVLGPSLKVLFGPQHGFEAVQQDNMIESAHGIHRPTGLPVFSLYSETREPSEVMLKDVDTMIVDIQIVGCRVYTFKYTIAACLRAGKKYGRRVVIMDRPNPLGGVFIEGAVLKEEARSFVGEFPIPMRHGLTAGEAALFFNRDIGCDLEVVKMEDWDPSHVWSQLQRHWVLTSPNLPTIDPVYVYPGTVIFEATNVSEGRGTGLPFQFVGAPYIEDSARFAALVRSIYGKNGGIYLREASFKPTSQKWKDESCNGVQIHLLDPHAVRSYDLGVSLLRAFIELGGQSFAWKKPGYEYNFVDHPIDLIMGWRHSAQTFVDEKFSLSDQQWTAGIEQYRDTVKPYLLYPRQMKINHLSHQ